jgi:predicted enzyme related to lactoylglutathione lyase
MDGQNPVGWFEIYVDDMARAKAFYESVFGAPLTRLQSSQFEMWGFPMLATAPGATGALVKMDGFKPGGNGVLVYFSCADCPKFSIGQYGHIALAVDTEGNMFGLHSMA